MTTKAKIMARTTATARNGANATIRAAIIKGFFT
jgi:hypothetical protein